MTPEHVTILTIDDTPANIHLLTHYLQREGYNIISAADGFEGFKAAVQHRPDLILLDIMMPGTDGYEVCRLLKIDEETQNIPVVFLTAKTEFEDRIHGFELGAVDYINKPFHISEISTRIKTQLQLRYLQNQNDRLLQIMHDFAKYASLGLPAETLDRTSGKNTRERNNDEEESMQSAINSLLTDVTATNHMAEKYRKTLEKIASYTEARPLYQLLDDTVDLVRQKHSGPLRISCDKPASNVMVNVHSGLAMHAMSELMTYAARRTFNLELLEIRTDEQKTIEDDVTYQRVNIIARGGANTCNDDLEKKLNKDYSGGSLSAAVSSVRSIGGRVTSQLCSNNALSILISLPA